MKQNRFLQYLYFLFLKDSFTLEGRASRLQYIARTFVVILSLCGLYFLSLFGYMSETVISKLVISILPTILLLYTALLEVRRLHDLGFSGWWILLIMLLSPLALVIIILFSIIRGTKGENKYGEESKF